MGSDPKELRSCVIVSKKLLTGATEEPSGACQVIQSIIGYVS